MEIQTMWSAVRKAGSTAVSLSSRLDSVRIRSVDVCLGPSITRLNWFKLVWSTSKPAPKAQHALVLLVTSTLTRRTAHEHERFARANCSTGGGVCRKTETSTQTHKGRQREQLTSSFKLKTAATWMGVWDGFDISCSPSGPAILL
ncbi:hypothetical protein SRHO_G00245180 [Serrasalmus rhombeus]